MIKWIEMEVHVKIVVQCKQHDANESNDTKFKIQNGKLMEHDKSEWRINQENG